MKEQTQMLALGATGVRAVPTPRRTPGVLPPWGCSPSLCPCCLTTPSPLKLGTPSPPGWL